MKSTHRQINSPLVALALCLGSLPAVAQSPVSFDVNAAIPDGSPSGLADTHSLSFAGLSSITSVQVNLDVTGGFNGDYFGYVSHNGVMAVLLNRVGQSSGNPGGYDDSGLNVTFSDTSPNDIHVYQTVSGALSGPLIGSWDPDARIVNPLAVTTSSPRVNDLSVFNGMDPSGDWTFFIADMSAGEQGTLANWGLTVTAVPEPATLTLLLSGVAAICLRRRK